MPVENKHTKLWERGGKSGGGSCSRTLSSNPQVRYTYSDVRQVGERESSESCTVPCSTSRTNENHPSVSWVSHQIIAHSLQSFSSLRGFELWIGRVPAGYRHPEFLNIATASRLHSQPRLSTRGPQPTNQPVGTLTLHLLLTGIVACATIFFPQRSTTGETQDGCTTTNTPE